MKIIVRVRELRKNRHLTQEELARQLNISRQSLISLEQGRWLPSLPLALQLAQFFDTSLEGVVCPNPNEESAKVINQPNEEVRMARDLTPWSPLGDEFDRFFDQSVRFPVAGALTFPTINIRHDEKNIFIDAHVPGFKEDDIDIDVADDMVTISGKSSHEENEQGKSGNYLRREYQQQAFTRTISLPPIESDKAIAKLTNGVLTITLPKLEDEKPKTKRIKPTS